MSNLLGELGGIAANTAGETVAYAAGTAGHRALSPLSEAIAQVAWNESPIALPAAEYLALGVAQGQVDADSARKWARKQGFDDPRWDALVSIANTGPALGYAFQAWRRGELTDAEFTTALRRTGLEVQWDKAMRALKEERLDLGAIATAIHRGTLRGHDLILVEPPTGAGNVAQIPQSQIDPVAEAAAHGVDAERLRILVANTGLPPGLMEMLRLLNLGKVTEDDVKRAVAESNLRNEYMDVALELRRQLLTPTEYVDAHLRGWITEPEMLSGAALHGMEPADTLQLFKTHGRPIPEHQVTTGEARGGVYDGPIDQIPTAFLKALQQGSLRPEWYDLAYHNRYTYPSAFVLRSLATTGELTPADVEKTLLEIGWRPDFAAKVTAAWTGGAKGKADAHVAKAETQLWSALHKSYVAQESDAAAVTPGLHAAGVADPAAVLALWDAERALIHAQLTPAQIKKAAKTLPAEWPRARALAALEARGFSADEAATLLDE